MQCGWGRLNAGRALAPCPHPKHTCSTWGWEQAATRSEGLSSALFTFWGASNYPALERTGFPCLLRTGSCLGIHNQGVRDGLFLCLAEHLRGLC